MCKSRESGRPVKSTYHPGETGEKLVSCDPSRGDKAEIYVRVEVLHAKTQRAELSQPKCRRRVKGFPQSFRLHHAEKPRSEETQHSVDDLMALTHAALTLVLFMLV